MLVVGSALFWLVGLVPELRRELTRTLARLRPQANTPAMPSSCVGSAKD
jgi:hypothetical protein